VKCDHKKRLTKWKALTSLSPLYGQGWREIRKCNRCLKVELRK